MKTFLKHILPFLIGAAVGIAPYALAQDYVRFADMTGSSLVPTTNKIERMNARSSRACPTRSRWTAR